MPKIVTSQLRLRRAFRFGYFAFLGLFLVLMALFAIAALNGEVIDMLSRLISDSSTFLLVALGLGLSVPLFFAFWSLLGSAILGLRVTPPSMLDGIRD